MTLEELERQAYANGDVATVALLHRVEDELLDNVQAAEDRAAHEEDKERWRANRNKVTS